MQNTRKLVDYRCVNSYPWCNALQGVRRFKPTIGEMVVVVGLGSLGQLTCQILKANGCEVLAIDKDING